MAQKKIEGRALAVSAFADFIMATSGFFVFYITGIQALFLDGFFSLIATVSCIAAMIISKISGKRTKHYPGGMYFLEPLYAIFKSLLTLYLLIASVQSTAATAYMYFTCGIGTPINTAPVVPYAIAMVALCFSLGFFNRYQNKNINYSSTILAAESKSNFVDGILSLGVGIAVIPLHFIPINSNLGFLHYTGDFFITVILVLCSIKEPIEVFFSSFKELTGGTTSDKRLKEIVNRATKKHLSNLVHISRCNIVKIGMHIQIFLFISDDIKAEQLTVAKRGCQKEIQGFYEKAEIIFCEYVISN